MSGLHNKDSEKPEVPRKILPVWPPRYADEEEWHGEDINGERVSILTEKTVEPK